jgi:hypothetical protein
MKHLKTSKAYLTSFVFESSYYEVGRRSPFEYASINKRSKSLGFMVSRAKHCIDARGHILSMTRSYYRKESAASPPRDQRHICSVHNLLNKAGFPLGEILRAERNFTLSFLISSTREITRQRKIPLRAQNSA